MKPPWWFCCGWWSPWCVLDRVTRCKVRRVCDAHDRAIIGATADVDEGTTLSPGRVDLVVQSAETCRGGTLHADEEDLEKFLWSLRK